MTISETPPVFFGDSEAPPQDKQLAGIIGEKYLLSGRNADVASHFLPPTSVL
jgi:hypothetical protein